MEFARCQRISKPGRGLDRQMTSLRRGIGRLIDSYAAGVIEKTEFEPRIAGLKQRISELQERHQAAREAAETERDLALVISRLEDFSAKVITGFDNLDRSACRISFVVSYAGSKSTKAASKSFPRSVTRWSSGTKIRDQIDRFLATLYKRWSKGRSPGSAAIVAWPVTSNATRPSAQHSFALPVG